MKYPISWNDVIKVLCPRVGDKKELAHEMQRAGIRIHQDSVRAWGVRSNGVERGPRGDAAVFLIRELERLGLEVPVKDESED